MMDGLIKPFHDAAKKPSQEAAGIQASRKIIGHICSYTPEELIHAAGFHPMRLFPSQSEIVLAENHLQAYGCQPVRGILEDSLSGRLDHLEGAVFVHACDAIQRLSDIWRLKGGYPVFCDLSLPVKLNTPSAKNFLIDSLTRFKADLEKASGKTISNTDMHSAIFIFNIIRDALSRIRNLQSKHPGLICGHDFHALVRGSMVMDRQQAATLLRVIVDALEKKAADFRQNSNAKRIIITGSVCDTPDIYSIIENAGGQVAGDDLCTGERWFTGQVDENNDPVAAIADRILNRIICPAKHISETHRAGHLTSLAAERKADGVIFLLQKFCDPHAFDYPYLQKALDTDHIKTLRIETDGQQESHGQFSTRIETFIQML